METFFLACAVLGGSLFVVRLILQFAMGGGHHDVDTDHGGDSDASFKVLSLQGFTAFFMMFGLMGYAMLKSTQSPGLSLGAALGAGLASLWVIARIFSLMKGLESSGNLDPAKAVGQTGTVYLGIPASGTGQVQVSVQGSLRTLDATAKVEIETGALVKVTGVMDRTVLVVEKI